jgi:hypothetical protein
VRGSVYDAGSPVISQYFFAGSKEGGAVGVWSTHQSREQQGWVDVQVIISPLGVISSNPSPNNPFSKGAGTSSSSSSTGVVLLLSITLSSPSAGVVVPLALPARVLRRPFLKFPTFPLPFLTYPVPVAFFFPAGSIGCPRSFC